MLRSATCSPVPVTASTPGQSVVSELGEVTQAAEESRKTALRSCTHRLSMLTSTMDGTDQVAFVSLSSKGEPELSSSQAGGDLHHYLGGAQGAVGGRAGYARRLAG